ncbi:hypothetical protein M1O54_04610 [Dehalococcoidia bacterium]|nr:hypothetical protein [Dehalococcoidia bacterium]
MEKLIRWLPFLVLFVLLAASIITVIIQHRLVEQLPFITLIVATVLYALAAYRLSRATDTLAEISAKTYDPDLVAYSEDRSPIYGEHPVPGEKGIGQWGIKWQIVLHNPGLVAILVTGAWLEIAGVDPHTLNSHSWKTVTAFYRSDCQAGGEGGQWIKGAPSRVEAHSPGLIWHILLCSQNDVPKLLSEMGDPARIFKLRAHLEYEPLRSGTRHKRTTTITSRPFYVDENAQFGQIIRIIRI